jgi:phosphoribosyl 1,2-cyclic phosphate phosphodiesterase
MKIIVLGSGSAYGVPVIGGDWGDCDPKNPKNRRLSPSILIENGDKRILVDMTPDLRQQAERHNIRELEAVLFTHAHADHITGLFHMPMLMQYYKEGQNLPLYADDFTRDNIKKNWWYMFDPAIKMDWYGAGRPFWEKVTPLEKFSVGGLDITPFAQQHGRMSCMGYRIGNFAYSTDTSGFPPESEPMLEGLDVWLVECDRYLSNNPNSTHSHLERTLGWIEKYKPKKAYLCHLNRTMDYDKISKLLPANVELAYDNLEFTV